MRPLGGNEQAMRIKYSTAVVLIVTLHLLVPLALILWVVYGEYACLTELMARVSVLVLYVAFIYLMGVWVFASFYVRYILLITAAAVLIRELLSWYVLPLFIRTDLPGSIVYGVELLLSVILVYLLIGAVRSRFYDENPIDLSFPLKNGVFAVFEGGNGKASSLMNYHFGASQHRGANTNQSMKYAVDITRVTPWGNDAAGFLPLRNDRYAIFNQVVYSPCSGEVLVVENSWPNETPWSGTAPYNVGIHVLVGSGDFAVLMGHLLKDSIWVKAGDVVGAGQPLARAGNSGWTNQPHLHIQAMRKSTGSFWGWEGIPVTFGRRNPVKNRLFFEHR